MKGNSGKNTFSALINDIVENAKKFINLKAEYYTLTLAEKVSLLVARIVLIGFTAILCLVVLLLLILLIYVLLMSWIGVSWIVVLVEIGIVLLLILILWYFKEPLIIRPVSGLLIRDIFHNSNEKDEED